MCALLMRLHGISHSIIVALFFFPLIIKQYYIKAIFILLNIFYLHHRRFAFQIISQYSAFIMHFYKKKKKIHDAS